MIPDFVANNNDFRLFKGDTFNILEKIEEKVDVIFSDPPYFLSNNGLTINSGKIVSVNKGEWDRSSEEMDSFNYNWLKKSREILKNNGTIWISGTYHNIFNIGQLLTQLNFKILNVITWEKNNPPPNFSCRFFTHSTELIIWARKEQKVPHYYNYDIMKVINEGKQMKDVWKLPAVSKFERGTIKHPTQKALSVLVRIILASSKKGDLILDPFSGSSTTGIAANLLGRNFIGIEKEEEFIELSIERRNLLDDDEYLTKLLSKIQGFPTKKFLKEYLVRENLIK
ncbi:site-specific DNA-methyltransferase [Empedobacter falsenii]